MTAPVRVAPYTEVEPIPPAPPANGLINLARTPVITDDRWIAGYSYIPDIPATTAVNRSSVTATRGLNMGTGAVPTSIETIPWMLEIEKRYSTFRFADNGSEHARKLLEAYTSKLLERELWTGEVAVADNLPNRRLASADAVDISGGTPVNGVQNAVSALVGAMAEYGMGDCMIHAPKALAVMLPDGWRNEQTYEDHGFVVVPGAGYPGTGPAGTGTNWMYATEIVNVRLTDIEVLPGTLGEAIDTRKNEIVYYAQRLGAVDFAGPVFACEVTL